MHWKSKRTEVGVVLREFDSLDEERRRFHCPALGTHQAAGVGVKVDVAFEQANTFLARLYLVNVQQTAIDFLGPFVGKLVVCRSDRGLRTVFVLHMIHFRLKKSRDHVALHKTIPGETQSFEHQSMGGSVMAAKLVFPALRSAGKLGANQRRRGVLSQSGSLLRTAALVCLQRQLGCHARQLYRRDEGRWTA